MSAWFALLKKELRIGLPVFIVAIGLYVGLFGFNLYAGYQTGLENHFKAGALYVILMMHIPFLLFYILLSLTLERTRLHLWLHNPMPIPNLLLAKLVSGFVYLLITYTIVLAFTVPLTGAYFPELKQSLFNIFGLATLMIFGSALWVAVLIMFFWAIFMIFSRHMNDFLSFLLTFGVSILLSFLYNRLMELGIMETLTAWGAIRLENILYNYDFNYIWAEGEIGVSALSETTIFHIGEVVKDTIVGVLLFFGASWLIEKKVEV